MKAVKKIFIALSAILVWTAIPAVSAHAVSVGQACPKATLGTRVSIRVNKKPVIVVCRNVAGRKKWIRAAVQSLVTTTTSTSTTSTTIPVPTLNFTDSAHEYKPNLRFITVEGMQQRAYFLHIPASYQPGQPVPLLLAFHGRTSNGGEVLQSSQFVSWGSQMNFIVASVNAATYENITSWNAGTCCAPATDALENDVLLTSAIIEAVKKNYDIDSSRVWAAGHSNGGMMAYRLACDLSDKITAIAVVVGSLVDTSCNPANQVSLLHIHGDLDPLVPVQGGGKLDTPNIYYSVLDYAKANSCNASSSANFTSEEQQFIWNCPNSSQVQLVNYLANSHEWAEGYSKDILRFLFAHPRK
jgi:polyhydroxybutyrate depolymerase